MIPTLEEYWAFTEQTWQLEDLREAALTLQDTYELEPNVLLLALLLQESGSFLSTAQFEQIDKAQARWSQQLLTPYRRLRKLAKGSLPEESIQQMLQVELDMERKCQKYILGELCEHEQTSDGDNLYACLSAKGIEMGSLPEDLLKTLDQSFYPEG